MSELFLWLLVGGALAYVSAQDLRSGEFMIPHRLGPIRVERADYPMIFYALIGVRISMGILLILLLSGRLFTLIEWCV